MNAIPSGSVDLIVTSPPYPMIEMWDDLFAELNRKIGDALSRKQGPRAYELMHKTLDPVWEEVYRILRGGGIACINIGDATRTIDGNFALYPNHSRILTTMLKLGFSALPVLLWRKQTNAPNKFMGSGMMPPGAYVTLEHEYILILRKGPKREFIKADEKRVRQESSFFWEERNVWFSDIWFDLKGASQNLNNKKMRLRSAAFPFELPYRLINMFSMKSDTVVDPFYGIGTTMFAAMAAGRNSIGFELDPNFRNTILSKIDTVIPFSNQRIRDRIKNHIDFVKDRVKTKGLLKYKNIHYHFPVMTNQETKLLFNQLKSVKKTGDKTFEVNYSEKPQKEFCQNWEDLIVPETDKPVKKRLSKRPITKKDQLSLLDC